MLCPLGLCATANQAWCPLVAQGYQAVETRLMQAEMCRQFETTLDY